MIVFPYVRTPEHEGSKKPLNARTRLKVIAS